MIQDKARHIRQLTPANRGAVMKAVTKNVIPARAEIHGKRPIFGDSNAAQSRASLKSVALKVVVGGRLRGHDGGQRSPDLAGIGKDVAAFYSEARRNTLRTHQQDANGSMQFAANHALRFFVLIDRG